MTCQSSIGKEKVLRIGVIGLRIWLAPGSACGDWPALAGDRRDGGRTSGPPGAGQWRYRPRSRRLCALVFGPEIVPVLEALLDGQLPRAPCARCGSCPSRYSR